MLFSLFTFLRKHKKYHNWLHYLIYSTVISVNEINTITHYFLLYCRNNVVQSLNFDNIGIACLFFKVSICCNNKRIHLYFSAKHCFSFCVWKFWCILCVLPALKWKSFIQVYIIKRNRNITFSFYNITRISMQL